MASTIVGVSAPERVDELIANDAVNIPPELWTSIAGEFDFELKFPVA